MRIPLFAAVAMLSASLAAHADTLNIMYSGSDTTGGVGTSSGSGSISFAGSPSALTLAGITSFSFSQTTVESGAGTSTFVYTLADLTSFSATLNADTLQSLAFNTDAMIGSNAFFYPESFRVTSLSAGGAETFNSLGEELQAGQVSQSVTPEPSSFLSLGTGLLGMAGVVRKRFA